MKTRSAEICEQLGGKLVSADIDLDHIHLFVEMPPQQSPMNAIRVLKTQLSKGVHANPEYAEYLKQYLYDGNTLWSPSYFVCTTGALVMEKVKAYIESQRTDEHRRKYVYSGR